MPPEHSVIKSDLFSAIMSGTLDSTPQGSQTWAMRSATWNFGSRMFHGTPEELNGTTERHGSARNDIDSMIRAFLGPNGAGKTSMIENADHSAAAERCLATGDT